MMFHHDLLRSLGMGAESNRRPQQVICYRVGDKMLNSVRGEGLRLVYLPA